MLKISHPRAPRTQLYCTDHAKDLAEAPQQSRRTRLRSRTGGGSGVNEGEPVAGNEEGQQQPVQLQQHAGAVDVDEGRRRQSDHSTGAMRPDSEGMRHGTAQ